MDYLVIRTSEEVKRIHLDEISAVIVESLAVSFTSYLLNEMVKREIMVLFCDERHLPISSLNALYGAYDSSSRLRNQIGWDAKTKEDIWAEIIKNKIHGQSCILDLFQRNGAKLQVFENNVVSGDTTNREGHAAKVYFHSLFGKDFNRDSFNDQNALLDYGYSILLAATAREICALGYSTQIGIFHNNTFNHYNLASDLMEPFRPFWDHEVVLLSGNSLCKEEKRALINVLNKTIVINDKKQYINNALHIYVASVLKSLEFNDISLISFPNYELSFNETDRFL